jgi:3'-phosphoadenosine 5'-phosphosulfate sulfotransferase (PAPS reductase)/FAD synthetase
MNIINFSGGRTSAYMTKRLIEEGLTDYIVTFQNTGKEMPQTLDFINECDKRWGLNIVWLEYRFGNQFEVVTYETASKDGRPFAELIEHKKHFLPNTMTRYCTTGLKIDTSRRYLQSIGIDEWIVYNGIRYDEPRRWSKAKNLPSYKTEELPLVKWKVTKKDVLDWWKKQDFDLQLNEPYGNCDCCFLKGKGKLAIIAKEKPELFNWWIDKEKKHFEYGRSNKGSFKQEITYQQIKDKAQSQLGLWDDDPSFECFCNID